MDSVITESCYKRDNLFNSFVKFLGKKIWGATPYPCYNEMCYNWHALQIYFIG